MGKVNKFLDQHVLPWPVKFLTFRLVILITMSLLIPLIILAKRTEFVLLYAMIAEVRTKQVAELQERRAQEDHTHVVEMHQLVLDNMAFQHEEIQDLKQLLAEMRGITLGKAALPHPGKIDLKDLPPRGKARFEKGHVSERLATQVRHDLGDAVATITLSPPRPTKSG